MGGGIRPGRNEPDRLGFLGMHCFDVNRDVNLWRFAAVPDYDSYKNMTSCA